VNYLKTPVFRSEKWLRAVASLPCMLCFREGATQAAHRNVGKGMGMKTDDCFTAALCVDCHAEIDQGGALMAQAWTSCFGLRQRLRSASVRT